MGYLKKNKVILTLAVLSVVFFFIYSYLPISQLVWQKNNLAAAEELSMRFNTPDEVINYYFSSQYARTGNLYYLEPLNNFMHRVIFPRWALVVGNKVTPGNFLGLDLIYGALAKVFGLGVIAFLTPFFSVLAVIFFYLLLKKIFTQSVALVGATLLLFFPAFWYYASRTMFHNILFLSLLITGLYFLLRLLEANKHEEEPASPSGRRELARTNLFIFAILTGLCFGLALITRTSEIFWIFLMILMVLMILKPPLKLLWPYFILILALIAICFVPVFYHNKILYDNYFFTGYNLKTMTDNLETGQVAAISAVRAILLPFGFHPRVMLSVIYNYFIKLFWPWVILWLVGLILFLRTKKTREQKMYLAVLLVVSCYLLIYYGSWFFSDSPLAGPSLGSSYVRYFLPVFIFNLPLIAFLLVKLWQQKIIGKILWLTVICWLLIVGFGQVFWRGPEALASIKDQVIKYNIQARDLLKKTAAADIILLDASADKIFFPERQRLIVPQNGVEWPEIKRILPYQKVYYFHADEKISSAELNQNKFWPQGMEIFDGVDIAGGGMLFKIITIK